MKAKFLACLPWLGFLLIVLGVRLTVCNQLATDAPLSDDWRVYDELVPVHNGSQPVLSSHLFERHGQHQIFFTKLQESLALKLNGPWQLRIENVFHALIFAAFALTASVLTVRASGRNAGWVFGLALATFAIPWAGGRTLWAFLSCFSWMMFFTLLESWVLVHTQRFLLRVGLSLVFCAACTVSLGSGVLMALVAAGWFVWQGVHRPDERRAQWIAAALHLALFVVVYKNIPPTEEALTQHDGLRTTLLPFLRGLGWPLVFVWPAGVLAFLPWFLLAWKWLRDPKSSTQAESLLFLLGGAVALQCAGIAIFRGENNNGGIPGNRYYDILLLGPLINAAILAMPGGAKLPASKAAWGRWLNLAWIGLTVAGMCANFFWRVMPWAMKQNGEWDQGVKQSVMAGYARGEIPAIAQAQAADEDPYALGYVSTFISERIDITGNQQAMLPASVVGGFPLTPEPASKGFTLGGFPGSAASLPYLRYWGSFAQSTTDDVTRTLISKPFQCDLPYLYFDLVLDKKARLKGYALPERSLIVENIATGVQIPILRSLRTSLPSLLRDRESVCVRLPAPGQYRVLATDNQIQHGWFAFSEPVAYGPLAAKCHDILNSGKALLCAGLCLLGLSLVLQRRPQADQG